MLAFSDQNFHKDSTMFRDQLVEHLTSWLTINPYKGCSLKCGYCFRANWHESSVPEQLSSVTECMQSLLAHSSFIKDMTPISINNSSTDPLLPQVKNSTFEAIEYLEQLELTNPFIIISKLALKPEDIDRVKALKFIRIIFFASLAFIPKHIEPSPIKPRIQNLINLQQAGIPTVVYFRPIVKGWNDSIELITKALETAQAYSNAICIGGLRMSPQIRTELSKLDIHVDDFPDDFHEKQFQKSIESDIYSIYTHLKLTVPLFKHSSCAVSHLIGINNYNLLYKNKEKNCTKTCPIEQQLKCNASNK